jgi:hypothetical protein
LNERNQAGQTIACSRHRAAAIYVQWSTFSGVPDI